MKITAKKFTDDPCSLSKREAVVQIARALLTAVTRLLILADMIDVSYLLQHLTTVSSHHDQQMDNIFHKFLTF